eukprot:4516904-Pyramimonas_sp.AAC.1
MQGIVTDSGAMSHSRHAEPLREIKLLDVVSVRAGHTLECLCRVQTDDVDVAADVQKDRQHSIHHGTAVRGQGQSMAFSEYTWHFGQRGPIQALAAPLL